MGKRDLRYVPYWTSVLSVPRLSWDPNAARFSTFCANTRFGAPREAKWRAPRHCGPSLEDPLWQLQSIVFHFMCFAGTDNLFAQTSAQERARGKISLIVFLRQLRRDS